MHLTLPTAPPLRILVTGAAGLIGRDLCSALVRRGHAVTGLLHRRAERATAARAGATDGAICLIDGNVAEPHLGLAPGSAARLAGELDLIVHCAAVTGFSLPAETYQRVNVGGTNNVLGFAGQAHPPVPLLHVSTAYVCGAAQGAIAETPAQAGPFNNGYEASKQAAETLVLAAHAAGQVAAVARPSIVVGHWADGQTEAFGTIYQLIRLVAEGRIRTLPAPCDASLDLVPLDHVVNGLADIAERMTDANGRVFHLASGCPVALSDLSQLATRFPQLQVPHFVAPERFQPATSTQRDRWLQEQVVAAYACYLRPSPWFATVNLVALNGRRCPPVDTAFLARLIAYAVSAGYLPAGRVEGGPDRPSPPRQAAERATEWR